MFTKRIYTGGVSVKSYRKVLDWDTIFGAIIVALILIAIAAS